MPVACDLYLPEEWACDRKRRLHAGVPPHLTFRTKIEMALDQIRHAVAAGLPRGIVLADAAYGGARSFRDALRDLALSYALGIESNTTVVPVIAPGHAAASDRSVKVQAGAVRVDVLAGAWEPRDWRTVSWREGSAGQLEPVRRHQALTSALAKRFRRRER